MLVEVHLYSASTAITHEDVDNTYTKDGLFCLKSEDVVHKYPTQHIFRITQYEQDNE